MKKILTLSLLVLVAGVVGQGCVYMDHPASQFAGDIVCEDGCGGYENASGMHSLYMLTTGVDPEIEGGAGGYYGNVQNIDTGQEVCELWDAAGAGYVVDDTLFNRADGLHNGCSPGFNCLTGAAVPLFSQFGANCWNQADVDALTLAGAPICGSFNGECGNQGWVQNPAYSIDPGPGAYEFQPFYRVLDKTPGTSVFEGSNNMVRAPGGFCEGCGVAAPVPDDCEGMGKVLMCHIPRGNPDNAHEICISASAVPAHLAHGDTEGSCGGGGGPGIQLPAGNNAPLWALGYGFPTDFTFQTIGAIPYTDDWNGGQGPIQGSVDRARSELVSILAQYNPDAQGMSSIQISKVSVYGETYVLSEPFDLQIGVDLLPEGGWNVRIATPDRHLFREITDIVVNNMDADQPVNLAGWKFELGDGQVVPGALVTNALYGKIVLNHDALIYYSERALEPLSDGLNNRLDTVRTSR